LGLLKTASRLLPRRDTAYSSLRRRLERFVALDDARVFDRYADWMRVTDSRLLGALIAPAAVPTDLLDSLVSAYDEATGRNELDRLLHLNLRTYLPDDLAVKMDRCSMSHGLELRSPFLDAGLIELLARVPAARKVGLRQVKPLLRRTCGDLVPGAVWRRRKHGFGVPVDAWFRGPLRQIAEDELLSGDARVRAVLNGTAIDAVWREHAAGTARRGAVLWTLLTLERWLRALESARFEEPASSVLEAADIAR